ncbi:MAG: hypothetical protein JW808_03925 [Victivallales bacterium]|nr:hypothetical protein [Victivallales bacterium]
MSKSFSLIMTGILVPLSSSCSGKAQRIDRDQSSDINTSPKAKYISTGETLRVKNGEVTQIKISPEITPERIIITHEITILNKEDLGGGKNQEPKTKK